MPVATWADHPPPSAVRRRNSAHRMMSSCHFFANAVNLTQPLPDLVDLLFSTVLTGRRSTRSWIQFCCAFQRFLGCHPTHRFYLTQSQLVMVFADGALGQHTTLNMVYALLFRSVRRARELSPRAPRLRHSQSVHNRNHTAEIRQYQDARTSSRCGLAPPGVKHTSRDLLGWKTNGRAWVVLQRLRVSHGAPIPDRAFPRVRVASHWRPDTTFYAGEPHLL